MGNTNEEGKNDTLLNCYIKSRSKHKAVFVDKLNLYYSVTKNVAG